MGGGGGAPRATSAFYSVKLCTSGLGNNNAYGKILKTEGGRELIMGEIVRTGYNTSDKDSKSYDKKMITVRKRKKNSIIIRIADKRFWRNHLV